MKFKSMEKYYWIEESGVKNNTVREIDLNDERFIELIKRHNSGELGNIEICLKGTLQSFKRKIRDISFYKNYCIITWEHLTP